MSFVPLSIPDPRPQWPEDDDLTEDEIDAYVAAVLQGEDEEWVGKILSEIKEMDDEPDKWTIRRHVVHHFGLGGPGSRN